MIVRALSRDELAARLDEIAALRIRVFRDWPYLYDGDAEYERRYLAPLLDSPQALVLGALDGDALVGVSTATPMEDHAEEFAAAFAARPEALADIFYGAESLLLPEARGRGLYPRFFALREARARELGRRHVAFCGVVRPADHPARPPRAQDLGPVWRRMGYAPLPGVTASFPWREVGATHETPHEMQFWMRTLT